jgi:hypothetical protein
MLQKEKKILFVLTLHLYTKHPIPNPGSLQHIDSNAPSRNLHSIAYLMGILELFETAPAPEFFLELVISSRNL